MKFHLLLLLKTIPAHYFGAGSQRDQWCLSRNAFKSVALFFSFSKQTKYHFTGLCFVHTVTALQTSMPWFHDPEFFSSSSTSLRYSHHSALSSLHDPLQLCWHGVRPAAVWIDKLEDNPGILLKPEQLTVRATIQLHRLSVPAQLRDANKHFYWILHTKDTAKESSSLHFWKTFKLFCLILCIYTSQRFHL